MLTSVVLRRNFSIFTSCCTFSDIYWIRHVITWILLLAVEHSLKYEGHSLISVEHGLTSVQSGLLPLEHSRSQWPRRLRRRSSAARLLRLWFRIPPGHGYLSVESVVCCQVEVSATDDHSSRGVLPTVASRCVWSRNLENRGGQSLLPGSKNTTTMDCNARKTTTNICM